MSGKGDKHVFFFHAENHTGKKSDCYDSYVTYRENIKQSVGFIPLAATEMLVFSSLYQW